MTYSTWGTWPDPLTTGTMGMSTTLRYTQRFNDWNVALGWALNLWRTGRCEGKPTVRRDVLGWVVIYSPRMYLVNTA